MKHRFLYIMALLLTVATGAVATPNSIVINGTPQVGDKSISLTYYFDPANVPGIILSYAPTLKVKCAADNKWDEIWLSFSDVSSGTTNISLKNLGEFEAGKTYEVCFAYNNGNWVDEVFQSFVPASAGYTVSLKEGTVDATSWQGKAGEGNYQALPLEGVAVGTAVSVKYSGRKLVKSVKAKAYKMAAAATSADKGKLICTDGHIHAYGADAACTKARVAKIIYIGPTGHATYNHGLALALTDEGQYQWEAAKTACNSKNTSTPVNNATWLLASFDQWDYMMGTDGAGSYGALRDGFSGVGGSNLQSGNYWSSTESDSDLAWYYHFGEGRLYRGSKVDEYHWVRACLAFGAQGSDPDPIELTSTDGETWTLASMPDYDVELEVTYYPTHAITVKEGTVDATSWQGKAGEGNYQALPLEGVAAGTAVSVKYSGWKLLVKSVKAKKKPAASLIVNPAVGQVIGDDGKNYDYASLPGGVTAVAKICYVSGSKCLALALVDEGKMNWSTAMTTAAAHTPAITGGTWKLATKDEWTNMITAAGSYTALRDGFISVGGTNMQSDFYWSSTEGGSSSAWGYAFDDSYWGRASKDDGGLVRACLAFGAQGSDPDPIELTSTDGETWTLASMPEYDVELEVTYYTEGVELTKNPDGTWTLAPTPAFDVVLEVEYETALSLNEVDDNTEKLTEWNGYEADVTLTRTLAAGSWNTFAAPFSTAIPDGWTVKELTSATLADGTLTLNFANATSIEAGKPYLVKVAADTDLSTAPFTGAIVSKDAQPFTSTDVDFIPTLGATTIEGVAADDVLFVAAGNTLKNPTELPADIKGFRAYFLLKGEAASLARAFSIDFGDGEATGIISIEHGTLNIDHSVYDLHGRRIVGKPSTKGVYIQNGKKVINK